MKCGLSLFAMAAAVMFTLCPVVAQSEQNAAVSKKTADAASLSEIVRSTAGPFEDYCDGYGNPGANGTGYVSVITLHVGKVPKTLKLAGQNGEGLDGTAAFDTAEALEAYIGQINLIVASSFSGLSGVIWGYDIAKADELTHSPRVPLFTLKGLDEIPVYSMEPLLDAGKRLFGTREKKHFPMLPGAHITAAHKEIIVAGPTTAWCGMALGIAKDRSRDANLIMELCGELKPKSYGKKKYFNQVLHKLADSVLLVGKNQGVSYKEIFVGIRHEFIPSGYVGAALATAPYVVLAKNAIPQAGPQALLDMTISDWENDRKTLFLK
ncbi:histidine decarboxylase, pyruvoyl type [Methylobacter sp. YRD-M1]|uniref:histidine decarboxylase, pyruvoyl type n=1 Tax=Methylobacter sp. YRD-M1 TaxID=2911520 RepID=UPI00227B9B68|nr:histidine decarboxylase, pyruvoyl type [Methylobacter sp. YRD-M1]WAK00279.1 histidine decarboxylase, pyruvoyl type [Methylobacter sp. YRD-M1]